MTPADEQYVLHRFTCPCGTRLEVHAQRMTAFQSRYSVQCPKCNKEHPIVSRPLLFFYEDGDHWAVKFLKPES